MTLFNRSVAKHVTWEDLMRILLLLATATTAAAIDRLVHHCVILELNIPSYRVEQAKKAKEEA